jgi:formylglycine-generating enzyme required for sulfatase activity
MGQVMRADGTCFWMDLYEATRGDYREFVSAPHLPQDGVCAWNTDVDDAGLNLAFFPPQGCVKNLPGRQLNLVGSDAGLEADTDVPMVCVDFCDALAFCTWAGKDLCRDDNSPEVNRTTKSDWYRACTAGNDANLYSYACGGPCDPAKCNGSSSHNNAILPVGQMPECKVPTRTGSAEIADLSGNVAEWTNFCSPTTSDGDCQTRGGSYASDDSALECGRASLIPRNSTLATLGFRCCKDSHAGDGG